MIITTLLSAIAVGTFWFWAILVIASIIITACVENEHYPTPSIVAILIGLIYWKAIASLPWSVIALAVGIFALSGAIWSTFQWFRFVSKKAAYYLGRYGNNLNELQMSNLKDGTFASLHKALITAWIAFWPWDMFWTLTGDFFNAIYDAMANIYQRISDSAIGKFQVKSSSIVTPGNEDISDIDDYSDPHKRTNSR